MGNKVVEMTLKKMQGQIVEGLLDCAKDLEFHCVRWRVNTGFGQDVT